MISKHHAAEPQTSSGKRLATKRYWFELPLTVAARLAALCEMEPRKKRTQIVTELLTSALAEVERTLPKTRGKVVDYHPDTRQPIYLLTGPFAEFRGLTNKHHIHLEREHSIEEREPPYPAEEYMLGDD